MTWLDRQREPLLRDWLKRTKAPMLASTPDEKILWANQATENLLGWTSVELVELSWSELTATSGDLVADRELVKELVDGTRTDYQFQKSYHTKNGPPKTCIIDVVRYPLTGEIECCFVTMFPTDGNADFALGRVTEIRNLIIDLMERKPDGLTFEKISLWAKQHPIAATFIGCLLSFLLFGDRVFEIIDRFWVKK